MRLLLLAALVSSQIIGCAPRTKSGATIATVGGTAMTIGGIAMLIDLKSPGNDSDGDGVDEFPENDIACAFGGCLVALALIGAGVILGGSGLVALAEAEPQPEVPVTVASPPPPSARVDPRLVARLPEVATDDQTLQMAKQARAAAHRGDCDAAWLTVAHIHQRDPRYGNALVASAALAPCKAR